MFMLFSMAAAATCEFPNIEEIHTTRHAVIINGDYHSVKGRTNRDNMLNTLRNCDQASAAFALDRWRQSLRTTNWTIGIGVTCFLPVLIIIPFTSDNTSKWRANFVENLHTGGE